MLAITYEMCQYINKNLKNDLASEMNYSHL